MTPITAFLLDANTLRIAFPFDPATKDAVKAIGAAPVYADGKFRYWALPLSALDKLIAKLGDDLACDPEVYLATDAKTPTMQRAENDAWANRQGLGVQAQAGANFSHGGATADVAQATKLDVFLHDGLSRWAAQAEKEKARKGKGKRWTK